MDNTEKVFDILKKSDVPLRAGEIAEISQIDKKLVDKAIKELKKDDKIYSPKRCCYSAN